MSLKNHVSPRAALSPHLTPKVSQKAVVALTPGRARKGGDVCPAVGTVACPGSDCSARFRGLVRQSWLLCPVYILCQAKGVGQPLSRQGEDTALVA